MHYWTNKKAFSWTHSRRVQMLMIVQYESTISDDMVTKSSRTVNKVIPTETTSANDK